MKDNYVDELLVGIVDFSDIITEEEIIGSKRFKPSSIGECKIMVYGKEGDIPHFHIESKNKKFECCVKIYSAEYFSHNKYIDILSTRQSKQLNTWMEEINRNYFGLTNWQAVVVAWKLANPEYRFPDKDKVIYQPDYGYLNVGGGLDD